MLLQDNRYFTPRYVQIRTCSEWLSIRLYVSPGSNGSLTVYDDDNGLLAEARVFKGLVQQETSRWGIKDSWDGWKDPIMMKYYAAIIETEQYCLTQQCDVWTAFKVVDVQHDSWYGMDNVDGTLRPYLFNDGGNIKFDATKTFTLFWKASVESLWINAEDVTFTLNVDAAWFGNAAQFGIYAFCKRVTIELNPKEGIDLRLRLYASSTQWGKLVPEHHDTKYPNWNLLFSEAEISDIGSAKVEPLSEILGA